MVAAVCAAPLKTPNRPTDDPFYRPPEGFEKAELGEILRFRKMENPYGALYMTANVSATYQYLVKSENSHGTPIGIISTLLVPYDADPKKLLSFQIAEDSTYENCAPLYALQVGSAPATIITAQMEFYFIQAALNKGWYVVVPDYLGPNSTNTAGHLAGKAVLNSIRGVLSNGNSTGIDNEADVALWGYSGGSVGTGWGAQMHPTYAPELNLIGAAYGGVLVNATSAAVYNMGKVSAGLLFTTLNGLGNEYPQLNEWIEQKVFPNKLEAFRKTNRACLIQYLPSYILAKWEDYFMEGELVIYDEVFQNVTNMNNMLLNGMLPDIPIYLYNSKYDELLVTADTDKLYEHFCSSGVSVEYHQEVLSEHMMTFVTGGGGAFEWLVSKFNGTEAPLGCTRKLTLSGLLNKVSMAGISDMLLHFVSTLWYNKPVGPSQQ